MNENYCYFSPLASQDRQTNKQAPIDHVAKQQTQAPTFKRNLYAVHSTLLCIVSQLLVPSSRIVAIVEPAQAGSGIECASISGSVSHIKWKSYKLVGSYHPSEQRW